MTFLTRIPVHGDTRDRNRLHKQVMALFPDHQTENARSAANILFRVNPVQGHAGPIHELLVSSSIQPTKLPASAEVRNIDQLLHLRNGHSIRFRLDINPIRRRSIDDGSGRRKIVESAVPPAELAAYLEEKLAGAVTGIRLTRTDASEVFTDRRNRGQGNSRLLIVTVYGTANVADLDELGRLLEAGVGRGRSFGTGMLTVCKA